MGLVLRQSLGRRAIPLFGFVVLAELPVRHGENKRIDFDIFSGG